MKQIHRTLLSASILALVACAGPGCATSDADKSESLGVTRQAVVTSFTAGSIIIPMDNALQDNGMLRAYGLAYALLRANVPVQWVIAPGKVEGGIDFTIDATATVANYETNAAVALPLDYHGGPFVVAAAAAAAAKPVIDAWVAADTVTVVHTLKTGAFSANVVRTLTAAPNLAIFEDTNQLIGYNNLNAAGISDSTGNPWSDASPATFSGPQLAGTAGNTKDGALFAGGQIAFCHVSSEHYNVADLDTNVVAEFRSFLASPLGLAQMQCAATTTFENDPNGRFISTQGIRDDGNTPTTLTNDVPDDPLAQYDGTIIGDNGTTDSIGLALAGGAAFKPGVRALVNQGAAKNARILLLDGHLDGDATKGRVVYIAGHDFVTTAGALPALPVSTNPETNGVRLYLNTIFESPCALAANQPLVTLTATAPALTKGPGITFTISYTNTGVAPALGVVITDQVPAGTTFQSASNGGAVVGGKVTWNVGVVPPGGTASLTYTVNANADGTFTNDGIAAYKAWETPRTTTSNTTSTKVDSTPPETTIVTGPSGTVPSFTATFDFSSNETPVTYECSLDGGAFTACSDPSTFNGLDIGPHTLSVRAIDAAGNADPTPATAAWTVVVPEVDAGTFDAGTLDSDGDGIPDALEILIGTNPFDADTDDDGVLDGLEIDFDKDTDGDGLINALDPDSDNDGLFDGTEQGLGCGEAATDITKGHCIPDADPTTTTNPLLKDTDNGKVRDGDEDANHNGKLDPGETDPTAGHGADDVAMTDTDKDGLPDAVEIALGSDPNDPDSDDDGVLDGDEPNYFEDTDGDGLINVLDADSDNDGLFDGTEIGKDCSNPATNPKKGACRPDGDKGATKTNPLDPDTDKGGVTDGAEDANLNGVVDPGETNPTLTHGADDANVVDTDKDGLGDLEEKFLGSNPNDADSDDDGVPDGKEANPSQDWDGDGLLDVLDPDSDNDGLFDGTEVGDDCSNAATDATKKHCIADADTTTRTGPLDPDTDKGGIKDGVEDTNDNGKVDGTETDPTPGHGADDATVVDTDKDGLSDATEALIGTNPNDADSDDDGVIDGNEPNFNEDTDGDGKINALDPDSDNDGLFDGTEVGNDCANKDTDKSKGVCTADGDQGKTTTWPLDPDTDHGSVKDGDEDTNKNGVVDPGERNPNDPSDDKNVPQPDGGVSDGGPDNDGGIIVVDGGPNADGGPDASPLPPGVTAPGATLEGGGIDCNSTSALTDDGQARGAFAFLAIAVGMVLRRRRSKR